MTKRVNGFPKFSLELKRTRRVFERLPHVAGGIAVEHAHKNFERESWNDKAKSSVWAPRKAKGDKSPGHRKLLVKSSEMRNSIDYEPGIMRVDIGISDPKVAEYAPRHNEGLAGMPKRQFLGPASEIDDEIEHWLDSQFDNIFD